MFPRILGLYHADHLHAALQRMITPFRAMSDSGYPVQWYAHDEALIDNLDNYDMVVLCGPATDEFVDNLRQQGKVLVFDLFDVRQLTWTFSLFHGCVSSTPGFLQFAAQRNTRTVLCEDYIDSRYWPQRQETDKLTVGLLDIPFRARTPADWEPLVPVIERIVHDYSVQLLVGDQIPIPLGPLVTHIALDVPPQDPPYYVNMVDIALCPISDTGDYVRRSAVLQYGLSGAAVVASPQFSDVIRNSCGTIATDTDSWEAAIRKYIEYPEKRKLAARSLHERVVSRYDVLKQVERIAECYAQLYTRIVGKVRKAVTA